MIKWCVLVVVAASPVVVDEDGYYRLGPPSNSFDNDNDTMVRVSSVLQDAGIVLDEDEALLEQDDALIRRTVLAVGTGAVFLLVVILLVLHLSGVL